MVTSSLHNKQTISGENGISKIPKQNFQTENLQFHLLFATSSRPFSLYLSHGNVLGNGTINPMEIAIQGFHASPFTSTLDQLSFFPLNSKQPRTQTTELLWFQTTRVWALSGRSEYPHPKFQSSSPGSCSSNEEIPLEILTLSSLP